MLVETCDVGVEREDEGWKILGGGGGTVEGDAGCGEGEGTIPDWATSGPEGNQR